MIPLSLVLHVYAAAHISYYKWKYKREDNHVYTITIRPINGQQGGIRECPEVNLNTLIYNEIIYSSMQMLLYTFGFVVILSLMVIAWYEDESFFNGSKIPYYFQDFFIPVLMNVIFPCWFYISNRKARRYLKQFAFGL